MTRVLPFKGHIPAGEQAALWVVRAEQGKLLDEERRALRTWLQASPTHVRLFREALAVNADADLLSVLADVGEPVVDAAKPIPLWGKGRWLAGIAATLIASVALLYLASESELPGFSSKNTGLYTTAKGQRDSVQLADGSRALLNTATRLSTNFSGQQREIRLEAGEAYFVVEPDPARPFVVHAGSGRITAVGTAFSVYRRNTDVEVVVAEGKVLIESGAGSPRAGKEKTASETELREVAVSANHPRATHIIAEPGQSITYDNESIETVVTVAPAALSRKLLWQQGMLAFENDPLHQVIAEFSRYTDTDIIIANPELRDIRVDGYFNADDIAGMLDSLRANFGIQVEYLNDRTIALARPVDAQ